MSYRLISKKDVLRRVPVTFPSLWRWMRAGRFPKPVRLGDGPFARVAWVESEVEAWIAARPVQRYKGDPVASSAPNEKHHARRPKP